MVKMFSNRIWKLASMIFVVFIAALMAPCVAIAAKVTKIADGDSITILGDSGLMKIRLADVDAPEKTQPYWRLSKLSLSDLCWNAVVRIEPRSIDRYGRTVAVVFCNEVNVNAEQVRRGMAWVFKKYASKTSDLYQIELDAKVAKIGLWEQSAPTPPWEFRSAKKRGL